MEITPVDEVGDPLADSKGNSVSVMSHNKLKIDCPEGDQRCEDNYFALFPQIHFANFRAKITLEDFATENKNGLYGLRFWMYTANPEYTVFLLALRYTLLGISIITGVCYLIFYRRLPKNQRTSEHNNIFVLSIALVFFNDPFYALTILKGTIFWAAISTLCVATMIALLISFFAMTFQRIYKEGSTVNSTQLNKKNVAIGFIAFCLCLISGVIAAIYTRFDPGLHANTEYTY